MSFKDFGALSDLYLPWLFFVKAQSVMLISTAIHRAVTTPASLARGEDKYMHRKTWKLTFFPDTISSIATSLMSHEFKRQVNTKQTPLIFSIRILDKNLEERK